MTKHPLQNRVLPTGDIAAIPQRGLFMGNRGGRMHDPATRTLTRQRYISRRWICCTLAFKNRQRTVMGEGYTELFFLDEVTALAAGHRPCFECQRTKALSFQEAFSRGNDLPVPASAEEIDRRLHLDRLDGKRQKTAWLSDAGLPDGVIARIEGMPHARYLGTWLRWTPDGYSTANAGKLRQDGVLLEVLTPLSTVSALSSGYEPVWHPSADAVRQNLL